MAATSYSRILLIEDNHDTADTLRMLLEIVGYDVQVSYSGTAGVRVACEWVPDIVVSDIGLPDLTGYEVASQLRQNQVTANIPLIAVTAYDSEEDRRQAFAHGFDYHLTKPAETEALLGLLAQVSK